jgi:hypothetical protein
MFSLSIQECSNQVRVSTLKRTVTPFLRSTHTRDVTIHGIEGYALNESTHNNLHVANVSLSYLLLHYVTK